MLFELKQKTNCMCPLIQVFLEQEKSFFISCWLPILCYKTEVSPGPLSPEFYGPTLLNILWTKKHNLQGDLVCKFG